MKGTLSEKLACYAADKFEKTLPLLGTRASEISGVVDKLAGDERILMEFLYGTMPLSDAADYEPQLFYDYVKHGLFLREKYLWTRELSEEMFLNYVLCHRVNSEALADCRGWFYEMLESMIRDDSLEEAVKRVNYWCASEASYAASDRRTISPEAMIISGSGRCGEESVFLVTALRSVGIAARQVYAPGWAHCDDNHAWVEAWVDGRWRFLGACEPEEVLDRGWFTNASSRAMLVHTRVFSDYFGTDQERPEITERDGAASLLNLTGSYARASRMTVLVRDEEGKPVQGAEVSFALLNMAEYREIARLDTDTEGKVSLLLGLGSIRLHVARGSKRQELTVENGAEELVEVILFEGLRQQDLESQRKKWQCADYIAPRDFPMHPVKPTKEERERGRVRKQDADRRRNGKLEQYCIQAEQLTQELLCGPLRILSEEEAGVLGDTLRYARGNFFEIYQFISKYPEKEALAFLSVLAPKDYRDIPTELLEEHFIYGRRVQSFSVGEYLAKAENPEELFLHYVWNPRIGYEEITPYRSFLEEMLSEEQQRIFCKEPERIWEWIQREIGGAEKEWQGRHYSQTVTTPVGVMRTGQGNLLDKKTLFVAICRTLGIPARLHPATGEAEYYKGNGFYPAAGGQEQKQVRLVLTSQGQPEYYASWTLGRLVRESRPEGKDGDFSEGFETLDLSGREFENGKLTLFLPRGSYRVITTVRLPDGNQLEAERTVCREDFLPGSDKVPEFVLPLYFREPALSQMMEELELEEFSLRDEDGNEVTDQEVFGGCNTLLAFLEEGAEPTEHFLNELRERRQEIRESGLRMVWVVTGKEALSNPTLAEVRKLLGAQIYYDDFQSLPEILARRMYTDPEKLPLVLLVSPERMGRYASSGYNVGNVGQLLAIAGMIKKGDNR